jgi:hypothetical protein
VLAVPVAVKLWLGSRWGLLADEAYHAVWAMRPAWGYFDQPPLVGWMLAPVVGAGHDGLLRLPAVLAGLFAALVTLDLHEDRVFGAAWWLGCVPLVWLTTFAVPDAFLLACWAGCIAAATRGGRLWWVAAAFGALAGLAKYTGLAVFPLAWWASGDRGRSSAVGWGVFVALLAPHAAWLVANDFVSVAFQAREGLVHPHPPGLLGPLQVVGQQLGVLNPLLAVAALVAWRTRPADRVARIAWWTSAPLAAFFLLASVGGPPEAHWMAPCWIGVGILLGGATGRLARLAWVGLGIGIFASTVLVVHGERGLFRLPLDPRHRVLEGRVLAEVVGAWALPEGVGPREPGVRDARPVLTERYQEAALIHWYTGIPARRHPDCGRRDQYDLWARPVPDVYLFVRPTTSGPLTCAGPVRARHGLVGQVLAGPVVGRWDLFEVGP